MVEEQPQETVLRLRPSNRPSLDHVLELAGCAREMPTQKISTCMRITASEKISSPS
jgi:hypothetical protein